MLVHMAIPVYGKMPGYGYAMALIRPHHYWVWEPDTGIIRSATTDSFIQYPEICLDMCTDSRYGNGACALTAASNTLNVGYAECTGFPNQVLICCILYE